MRILMLSNLYPPLAVGGYERACANVAEALFRRGHDIKVLTSWSHLPEITDPHYVDRCLDLRTLIPRTPRNPALAEFQTHEARCSHYANTLRVLDALRDFSPDLVYVWNLYGVGIAAIIDLLNIVGVPWAVHLMDIMPAYLHEGVPLHVLDVFGARDVSLWRQGRTIAMSRHLLDEIAQRSGLRLHEQTSIIPGWVDLSNRRDHAPYQRDGITRFVTAGAVRDYKGTGLIVEAAALLHAQGVSRFEIDVFGDGDIATYVDLAARLGVSNRVRFHGPRSQADLLAAYSNYDAFLFPTWEREPFGFAPLEAAGCGTPPIVTRDCGAAERLVADVHCLKIARTVPALADAMRIVIDGACDLERMAAAAASLVASDLTLKTAIDAIEHELDRLRPPATLEWDRSRLADPTLRLLAFAKHDLSIALRFE